MIQYVWSEKIDSILSACESLEVLGVRNWALDQAGALDALERLHHEGIAVAGGDVYRLENGRLEPTYDNWYCDRSDDEPIDEYIERSIDVARSYMSECQNSDGETLFSLVPVVW